MKAQGGSALLKVMAQTMALGFHSRADLKPELLSHPVPPLLHLHCEILETISDLAILCEFGECLALGLLPADHTGPSWP